MKGKALAVLGMTLSLMFCQPTPPPKTPSDLKREMVERLDKMTVALVAGSIEENEITLMPYCSGVWISKNEIITARHCISDEPIFMYQVYGSEKIYTFDIMSEDPEHDLALLKSRADPPEHPAATLAESWWAGQPVHIVGHTTGLGWTYIEGVISSSRMLRGNSTPPAIQISSPAWFGNSGGGAFNDDGQLVGISSWVSTRAPMLSFFVNSEAINQFLIKAQKR
ncbi:MAG: serine protease [Caulobacteraceae bacterium]|nr:serine protease [Caulobacteraceae bacterium]